MEAKKEKKKAAKQAGGRQDVSAEPAKGGARSRRMLAEMNLMDNFLFGSVVTYPEIGEWFVRLLLRTIFGREFRHLSITAQKVFYGTDADRHGARLDVYLETENGGDADGLATVYDFEPDRKSGTTQVKALPRRVRFYHGKIAARVLNSGKNYDSLKNVIIVMITPFDPFGMGRMVYTIKNHCVEVPKMPYEDGASTLFLYTKGTVGVPSEAVMQLLRYMENTIYENAANDDLRKLHEMVEIIRKDPEVNGMWMSITEDDIKQQLIEDRDRANEERDRVTEERDRVTEERDRVTEERDRAIENFMRATEKIAWYEKIMAEMKEKNK